MKVTVTYSDMEGSGCGLTYCTVEFSWRGRGNSCKCQDSRSLRRLSKSYFFQIQEMLGLKQLVCFITETFLAPSTGGLVLL